MQAFAAFSLPQQRNAAQSGSPSVTRCRSEFLGRTAAARSSQRRFSPSSSVSRGWNSRWVPAQPNVDEIVGVTYGVTKAHFRLKWVDQAGSDKAGRLGLLNLSPERSLWDFPLPPPGYDATVRDARDRRASSRAKCASSVEVYPTGEAAPIRTTSADLSLGGRFWRCPTLFLQGRRSKSLFRSRISNYGRTQKSSPARRGLGSE